MLKSRIKTVITLVLTLVVLFTTFVMPNKFTEVMDKIYQIKQSKVLMENTTSSWISAKEEYEKTINVFEASRTFELLYNDVESLTKVLNAVPGIKIDKIDEISISSPVAEQSEWVGNANAEGARLHLTVERIDSAMKSIEKAQLAVNSMVIVYPSTIILDIALGGGI